MKKAISVLICLQFVLTVFYPIGVCISSLFGYEFVLISPLVFAIITAIFSVCVVILDLCFKHILENKAICALLSVSLPLSLINALLYMLASHGKLVVASVFIIIVCCGILSIKHGKPLAIKVIALILSAIMFLPVGFFGFIAVTFGVIGQNTVVQTVKSPNGNYTAEVIDSDQGALGGDTIVNVHEKSVIDFLIFKVEKKPQRVYLGPWGAFKDMQIYWKNDGCLVINSAEYEIK